MGGTKDGKDDKKDGKDDASKLMGMQQVGLPAFPDLGAVPRTFVKVELKTTVTPVVGDIDGPYWEAVRAYGLIDSETRSDATTSTLVLSVSDVKEARAIVEGAPGVKQGKVTVTNVTPFGTGVF